jgi:hypothetical protein
MGGAGERGTRWGMAALLTGNAIGTRGNGSRSAADHGLRLQRLAPHGNPPPISPNRRKMIADRTVDRSAPHQKWFSKFLIT